MNSSKIFPVKTSFVFAIGLFLILSAFMPMVSAGAKFNGGGVVPNAGTIPPKDNVIMDPGIPLVVQPCGNISVVGLEHNASNYSQALGGFNLTAIENSTYNVTNMSDANGFTFNITAPCTTPANGILQNLTLIDNSSDKNNKTLVYFVSNATNVSVVFLGQKPPFALNTNNTVNITYFNGSTPLANNIPVVSIFNSTDQLEMNNIQIYNLSATTDATGTMQYNISVGANAASTYSFVVDYGYNVFPFSVQSAYGLSFVTQDSNGSTSSFFSPNAAVNLIAKTKYSNGTAYVLAGSDSIKALVTLPNSTVNTYALGALDAVNSPGVNNFTFTSSNLNGPYGVHVVATIQGNAYETYGVFNIQSESATVSPHLDFIKQDGRINAILPSTFVTFDLLVNNLTTGTLMTGLGNGGPGAVNCSTVVLNSFTDMQSSKNVSWVGTATYTNSSYPGVQSLCTFTVGVPAQTGDFRINVSYADPAAPSQTLNAFGIVSVKNYALRFNSCNAVSDFTPCGYEPFFLVGKNATFQMTLDNLSSGSPLSASNILNITKISVHPINFSGGATLENTSWVANGSFFLSYPQTDPNSVRLYLSLPSNMQTGPTEVSVTVNTTQGKFTSREFFIVKSTSINGFAFPYSANSNSGPQINCSGNQTFLFNAFDITTHQSVQGVKVEGVLNAQNMFGVAFDTTYLTGSTVNTTDSTGLAAFNVTINGSKKINGFVMMNLNISYHGNYDTAMGGFLCGSANYDLVPGTGDAGRGSFQNGGGSGPSGGSNSGGSSGVMGNPVSPVGSSMPVTNPTNAAFLNYGSLSFAGANQQQGFGQSLGINGTLKFLSIRFFNPNTGSQQTYPANGTIKVNVSNGNSVVGNLAGVSLVPSNFSLKVWPIGMSMLNVNLTNGTSPGNEQGPSAIGQLSGFQVTLFKIIDNATNNQGLQPGPQVPTLFWAGSNMTVVLNVSNNVSLSGNNITVKFMNQLGNSPATLLNVSEMSHNWNSPNDDCCGANVWNVTFTVPSLTPGPVQEVFTVNNSQGISNTFIESGEVANLVVMPLSPNLVSMAAVCSTINDHPGQNGSLQNCNVLPVLGSFMPFIPGPYNPPNDFATRLNLSVLNSTFSVDSVSRTVCFKEALNATDPNNPGAGVSSLDNTTYMALIDNTTAGIYDTLVVNTTQGNLTIYNFGNLTGSHRQAARFNNSYAGLYVVGAKDGACNALVVANASFTNTMGLQRGFDLGQKPVNTKVYQLFKVINNNAGVGGAVVDYNGLANGSIVQGQLNFNNIMPASALATRTGTSDGLGIVPLELNITVTGEYGTLWKANATVGGTLLTSFAKIGGDQTQNSGGNSAHLIRGYSFNGNCVPKGSGFFFASSSNQNLTATCTAQFFNGSGISNVNFTIKRKVFTNLGLTFQPMVTSNSSSGQIQTGLLSDGTGKVDINFTATGGWQTGQFYELQAVANNSGTIQTFDMPGVGFGQGGSGSFNGH